MISSLGSGHNESRLKKLCEQYICILHSCASTWTLARRHAPPTREICVLVKRSNGLACVHVHRKRVSKYLGLEPSWSNRPGTSRSRYFTDMAESQCQLLSRSGTCKQCSYLLIAWSHRIQVGATAPPHSRYPKTTRRRQSASLERNQRHAGG